MKRLVTLGPLLALLFSAVAQADPRIFTVGWETWEPYQFPASDGSVTGVDVEILRAALGTKDVKAKFESMPWKRILGAVQSGDVDLTMGATKTDERLVFARFSEPYRTDRSVLIVPRGQVAINRALRRLGVADQVETLPYSVFSQEVRFMLSRKSTTDQDLARLNEGLETIRSNGTYQKILDQFLIR